MTLKIFWRFIKNEFQNHNFFSLALSSGKTDKHEYVTGEEILPFNQKQIIEQAKCTYSILGKVFEKQTKTIEDHGIPKH